MSTSPTKQNEKDKKSEEVVVNGEREDPKFNHCNHNAESSPPPRSTASSHDNNSPNNLSYVSAQTDNTAPPIPRRSWRREDAPSPSTSLIQNSVASRRNVSSGAVSGGVVSTATAVIMNGGGCRLVTPLGSTLSPISSCGSVEAQQDLDKNDDDNDDEEEEEEEHLRHPHHRHNNLTSDLYDEEEDESTLMLLASHKEERVPSAEDGDELTTMSSLREDLSMRSNSRVGGGQMHGHHQHNLHYQQHNINNSVGRVSSSSLTGRAISQSSMAAAFSTGRRAGGGGLLSGGSTSAALLAHSPSPPLRQSLCRRGSSGRSRSPSIAAAHNQMVRGMLGTFRMPVVALQQILGMCTFKEMGDLRRVHPHWDELAGQLLNAAHSRLLQRAQHLLTNCQRRVHKEPKMAQPVQLLTRLHVQALNPVDGMRAFMDEGVLCFPYGTLLDLAFELLARVDEIIENVSSAAFVSTELQERNYAEADAQLDHLAELARRASQHYKKWVEPEAEKRMSALYQASAQQRLQRIDSFLVESSVSRVEREAEKARSELNWDMEQLRQQNVALKKEGRDLRQLCHRLDQRVDVLERKFKTIARLLQ